MKKPLEHNDKLSHASANAMADEVKNFLQLNEKYRPVTLKVAEKCNY
jgi:hypothetical protein